MRPRINSHVIGKAVHMPTVYSICRRSPISKETVSMLLNFGYSLETRCLSMLNLLACLYDIYLLNKYYFNLLSIWFVLNKCKMYSFFPLTY